MPLLHIVKVGDWQCGRFIEETTHLPLSVRLFVIIFHLLCTSTSVLLTDVDLNHKFINIWLISYGTFFIQSFFLKLDHTPSVILFELATVKQLYGVYVMLFVV